MKNIVIIDVDTDRIPRLKMVKPNSFPEPTTNEELKTMLMADMGSTCEALFTMISLASHHGFGKKEDFLNIAKNLLDEIEFMD